MSRTSKPAAGEPAEGVVQWRRERRRELIAKRQGLSATERQRCQRRIEELIGTQFPGLAGALLGFYWPFRGEIGVHGLVRGLIGQGARAALPVVVEKKRPLEFWAWHPGAALARGIWDIPVPAERRPVQPSVLLVPLVGFDARGYRLGHGGGYYDRTLAAMAPRPFTIGVGHELARLPTIHPQPHDIPMDAIVTEAGVMRRPAGPPAAAADEEEPRGFASPPCFMHELDPAWLGLGEEDEPGP
ncbi:5-formyltetrahydrofolate cyclo-ligase [Marinimicrococcus flavescens]|uniref:5-formyltetrahydrofolate cyclo-ligase n=1 Tax=Marinimicrococcus flavescens TaxID=3031815 RepID=A0AAP3XQH8_9PROT|nr:5-formyltetrahydrofolate cyclo-ligase [Marinimicrococcus flavescens]